MILSGICAWHISRTTDRIHAVATDADAAALAAG
jgi:hypothetical protein